jgi:hypothetical protein
MQMAEEIATALQTSFRWEAGLFPPAIGGQKRSRLREHVCCFADVVYPIQALSHYHIVTGDAKAAEIASACAKHMCELQGPQGQWWWHFDIRTGRVVEHYPVYAVHQDSMAPMALKAAGKALDQDYSESMSKGLDWLADPAEQTDSLVDLQRNVIWRKVARREPAKLVRGLQAVASRLHPGIRTPGVDLLFPPVEIDYETRPYHMAWILYAWPDSGEPA